MPITLNPRFAAAGQDIVAKKTSARVAIIGGSIGDYHVIQSADAIDYDNRGLLVLASMRMGCPLRLFDFAAAGVTAQAVVQNQLPQLVPGAYDYVAIFTGGNDILGGVDPAVTFDYVKIMVNYAKRIGAIPLLFTVPPYSAGALSTAQVGAQGQLNQMYLTLDDVDGGVFVYDAYSDLINPTSTTNAYKANFSYDNVHPALRGTWAASVGIATWLQTVVGIPARTPSVVSITDTWTAAGATHRPGCNLLDPGASFMQGSSGITGNLGSQNCTFTLTNPVPGNSASDRLEVYANAGSTAGMACTVTVGTDTDGQPFLSLALTITAAGQYIAIGVPSVHARAVDGAWYKAEAVLQVIGGSIRPSEVCHFLTMSADNAKRASVGWGTVAGLQGVSTDATLLCVTPRKQYAAANAFLKSFSRITFLNTGTCTIRLKQPAIIAYESELAY